MFRSKLVLRSRLNLLVAAAAPCVDSSSRLMIRRAEINPRAELNSQRFSSSHINSINLQQRFYSSTGIKMSSNPILQPWDGSRGGFPKFDGVNADTLRAALEEGMELNRKQINAIASNPEPATFANTIEAMEDAGREYQRATGIYGIYVSSLNVGPIQDLETEMEPKMAAFADEIVQNDALFKRISAVYHSRSEANLSAEQDRLVTVLYENFHRNGAALNEADKKRLAEINTKLATLYSKFGQNLLAEEGEQLLVLKSEADLAGLDADFIASAKSAAEAKKLEQPAWAIMNTRSAMEPFLTTSARRDLREKAFKLFVSRGANDGPNDNRPLIAEILTLRKEKAGLLGHRNFAEWILSDNMAKTPANAMKLMEDVWSVAVVKARRDIAEMTKIASKDGIKEGEMEAWDHRYYAEKLRKAEFDLDDAEVKPYLQLDKMIEGMLWCAEQLHGLKFEAVPEGEVSVWHPDVRVFQVLKKSDDSHVGLFYLDPYAREGKRSGAWMCDHRPQEAFKSVISPIISNNSNFMKASSPDEPNLITISDATTLFHEFGHGLHGLLSKVSYPSLAGTSVRRDFVELPSQLNEHWLFAPELLNKYARHYKTNEPMPATLLAKIDAAKNADQGFSTVEYLSSALYDMAVHTNDNPAEAASDAFEGTLMTKLGLPKEIVMRHRPTHFQHVYCTEGYASAYYSYLWADALTADAAEAFTEKGSMFDVETATKLRECILMVGNSVDPAIAYRNFRGRDADPQAVMRKRGFAPAKQ